MRALAEGHQGAPEEIPTPPPDCSFEAITDSCKIFDPEKPNNEIITLPDGSSIPNYAAVVARPPKSFKKQTEDSMDLEREFDAKKRELKKKQRKILNRISKKKMHPDFKEFLLSNLGIDDNYLEALGDIKPEHKNTAMEILWPPDRPNRKTRQMEIEGVQEQLKQILGPKRTELRALAAAEKQLYASEATPAEDAEQLKMIKELKTTTPQRRERAKELFEIAKDGVKQAILMGRQPGALSDEERSALIKVDTVGFTLMESDDDMIGYCSSLVANAEYNAATHSIKVCPSFFRFPDAQIVSVFGHEIGHSVDPCTSQFPTYQIDRNRLAQFKAPRALVADPEISENADRNYVFTTLQNIAAQGATMTTNSFAAELENPETIHFFTQPNVGILIPVPGADAIPAQRYIFSDVENCLSQKEGGAFNRMSDAEADHIAESVSNFKAASGEELPNYDPKEDRKKIRNAFVAYPGCVSGDRKDQMGEAMADWLGAKALRHYFKQMEEKKIVIAPKVAQLSSIAYFANIICMKRYQNLINGEDNSPAAIVNSAMNTRNEMRDEHPANKARIEKIFLRELAPLLDCPDLGLACGHTGQPAKGQPSSRKDS